MGMAVSFDIREPAPASGPSTTWCGGCTTSTPRSAPTATTARSHASVAAKLSLDELGHDTQQILLRCIELTDLTGGAFDAFAVPAPNGTHARPVRPRQRLVDRTRRSDAPSGWGNELLHQRRRRHRRARRGCAGTRSGGLEFVIRTDAEQLALVLDVCGPIGIATSATYERGAHIIDPHVGAPTTALASATVIGTDLGTADALRNRCLRHGNRFDRLDRNDSPDTTRTSSPTTAPQSGVRGSRIRTAPFGAQAR